MKKLVSFNLAFLVLMLLCSCVKDEENTKTEFLLDTVVTLTASCDKDTLDGAFSLCKTYESLLSKTEKGSDVYIINTSIGNVRVDEDTLNLLKKALYYCEISDGKFDVTLYDVISLWDFNNEVIPSRDEIAEALKNVDYNSIIIFLTAHEELGYTILQKEFLFLSFINKYDNYEPKLLKSIKTALRKINSNQMLKYNKNGVVYTIPLDDILYILRDSVERKCIIKTDYLEILISKQLKEIKEELTQDFVYSHRSCIVNKNKVRIVDFRKHKIVFDNNETLNLVSNKFKKEFDKK